MGGNQSSSSPARPLSNEPSKAAKVAKIADDVSLQFLVEFPMAFKYVLIQQYKASHLPKTPKKESLLTAPLSSHVLKRGELYKKGVYNTGWRKRYFVATNVNENYLIKYYDDDKETQLKGEMNCFGYRVSNDSDQFSIILTHFDGSKRTWHLKAEDDIDCNEWKEVFSNACRHSMSDESNHSSQDREAFDCAYRATRIAYGYFGYLKLARTEMELLSLLLGQVIRRELYQNSTEHEHRVSGLRFVEVVDKEIEEIIKPILLRTLQQTKLFITAIKQTYSEEIHKHFTDINSLETQLTTRLHNIFTPMIQPLLLDEDVRISSLLSLIEEPITQAYLCFHEEFHQHFHNNLLQLEKKGRLTAYQINELFVTAYRDVEKLNAKPLAKAQTILWNMFTMKLNADNNNNGNGNNNNLNGQSSKAINNNSDSNSRKNNAKNSMKITNNPYNNTYNNNNGGDVVIFRNVDVNPYHIYLVVIDQLRQLARNAVYTLQQNLAKITTNNNNSNNNNNGNNSSSKGEAVPEIAEVVSQVRSMYDCLVKDMKVFFQQTLKLILTDMLEYTVQEMFISSCAEITKTELITICTINSNANSRPGSGQHNNNQNHHNNHHNHHHNHHNNSSSNSKMVVMEFIQVGYVTEEVVRDIVRDYVETKIIPLSRAAEEKFQQQKQLFVEAG